MNKVNVYGSFTQALLFSGALPVPKYLLENYIELGISSQEFILILHILSDADKNVYPTVKELAKRMGIPEKEIENSLARLLECEFLAIEKHWDSLNNRWFSAYNLIGLINELAEHWAIESFKRFEIELVQKKNGDKEAEKDALSPSHPQLSSLIKTYEKELGRPLTGMECEFIGRWLTADFSQELIVEALRRGVGAGIRNFRYLDSILREWEKKNLRTLTEIEAEDAFFQERHEKKTRSASKKKTVSSKYDNFDL